MRGINKVIIVGQLGKDPEVKYMPNGDAVCNFSVATSESWKDKNTGEQVEKTEWHRVTVFKSQAENAGKYLKKGSKVYVEGKIQTRKYQAADGTDRYSTDILARDIQYLDSRSTENTAPQSAPAQSAPAQQAPAEDWNDDDSDLSF